MGVVLRSVLAYGRMTSMLLLLVLDSLVPFACVQDLTRAVLIREWCMVLVGSMAA